MNEPHVSCPAPTTEDGDWRRLLATAISRPEALLRRLRLPESLLPGAVAGDALFRLRVPAGFVARMRPGDPHDPLLRQVLPLDAETHVRAGFGVDPVGDLAAAALPGILHKYRGRALVVATGACAVHCRYCFRRHFPYAEQHAQGRRWHAVLTHLSRDRSIREVILSGGDPLVLPDDKLATMVADLQGIRHISRLRVHSRLPVVLPERVTAALTDWLGSGRLRPVLVIHANHPNELDHTVEAACRRLQRAGVTLLNQSVLLRGVNDSAEVLVELSERLFAIGVLPYYVHLLDRVQGAAHFLVDERRARGLLEQASRELPGYLVPRLVREEAGAPYKTLITPHGQAG